MSMDYEGRYSIFDPRGIATYPLTQRGNKVKLGDLVCPENAGPHANGMARETRRDIDAIARAVVAHRKEKKPVILFTGAHLIKNGLGPLLVDLIRRHMVTLVAGNGATAIHDFELALTGETSERVPNALPRGQFGMAYEFAYINTALAVGDRHHLGFGESLGRMICDGSFCDQVLSLAARKDSPRTFAHPDVSVLAACYENGIPFTVHAGLGVDVTDQHPSFDGRAKGGCSGRDFLIFVREVAGLTDGGVALNIGSAVHGPEVLLKAVSMTSNVDRAPHGIITANFDFRDHNPARMADESAAEYYFRDQKSVVTRIPQAFGGRGYYIKGCQKQTFPCLYRAITAML